MKKLFYIVVLGLLVFACRQFEPTDTPSGNEPVFKGSGLINGQEVSWDANGTAFNANTSSFVDSLDVSVYSGFYEAVDCQVCEPSLEVKLRSLASISGPEAVLSQDITPLRFLVNKDSLLTYQVSLQALPIADASSVDWIILGNSYSGDSIDFEVDAAQMHKVPYSYTVTYLSGCTETEHDTVYLPNNGCDGIITSQKSSSNNVVYTVKGLYGSTYSYEWNFKDGSSALTRSVQFFYGNQNYSQELASLKISNDQGVAYKYFHQAIDSGSCAANTSYSISEDYEYFTWDAQPDHGEISIMYRENGITYSSEVIKQPDWASFKVISYEGFEELFDSENQYLKAEVLFNGLVANGSDVKRVENLKVILPFKI